MSYGRSFQFIAAECLKQRDDETVHLYPTDSRCWEDERRLRLGLWV